MDTNKQKPLLRRGDTWFHLFWIIVFMAIMFSANAQNEYQTAGEFANPPAFGVPGWIRALVSILFILYYACFDGLADAWIFRDYRFDKGASGEPHWMDYASGVVSRMADLNTNWHRAQAMQQGGVILVVAFLSGYWQTVILGAGAFWLVHDGIVNTLGLGRGFFFVGTTAWIDRMFQKLKHPEFGMAFAKIAILLAGILSFIIF